MCLCVDTIFVSTVCLYDSPLFFWALRSLVLIKFILLPVCQYLLTKGWMNVVARPLKRILMFLRKGSSLSVCAFVWSPKAHLPMMSRVRLWYILKINQHYECYSMQKIQTSTDCIVHTAQHGEDCKMNYLSSGIVLAET